MKQRYARHWKSGTKDCDPDIRKTKEVSPTTVLETTSKIRCRKRNQSSELSPVRGVSAESIGRSDWFEFSRKSTIGETAA